MPATSFRPQPQRADLVARPLQSAAANLAASADSAFSAAPRRLSSRSAAIDKPAVQSGGVWGWLSRNIRDRGLQTATTARAADGTLDRTDMVSIFRRAKDGNRIDRTELKDLQKLVKNGSRFAMSEDVQVLSNKVAFGNAANRSYQGKALGNLRADSSGKHLEQLVNKWFFGGDRPLATSADGLFTYRYQYSNASLFQDGISFSDIAQGDLGNCYLLSGLGATALHAPQQIQNMFIDNGDGTFTVRFYRPNGAADYVTVDRHLPVDLWGNSAYANHSSELWVGLAEKAYVQWSESGLSGQENTNSYQGTAGGYPEVATEQITGRSADWQLMTEATPAAIADAFAAGQLITFDSKASTPSRFVEESHAYTLIGYDAATQTFKLYNPWRVDAQDQSGNPISLDGVADDGKVDLTWADLSANFNYWNFTVA